MSRPTTQDSILRAGVHKYREILPRTFCWPRAGQGEQASAGHDNLRGASKLRTARRLAPTRDSSTGLLSAHTWRWARHGKKRREMPHVQQASYGPPGATARQALTICLA